MEKVTIKPQKNISLFPLKPEEALAAFMKVDPRKVLEAELKEREEARISEK